jgi:hypothetical protein
VSRRTTTRPNRPGRGHLYGRESVLTKRGGPLGREQRGPLIYISISGRLSRVVVVGALYSPVFRGFSHSTKWPFRGRSVGVAGRAANSSAKRPHRAAGAVSDPGRTHDEHDDITEPAAQGDHHRRTVRPGRPRRSDDGSGYWLSPAKTVNLKTSSPTPTPPARRRHPGQLVREERSRHRRLPRWGFKSARLSDNVEARHTPTRKAGKTSTQGTAAPVGLPSPTTREHTPPTGRARPTACRAPRTSSPHGPPLPDDAEIGGAATRPRRPAGILRQMQASQGKFFCLPLALH